jgi:protein kinase A
MGVSCSRPVEVLNPIPLQELSQSGTNRSTNGQEDRQLLSRRESATSTCLNIESQIALHETYRHRMAGAGHDMGYTLSASSSMKHIAQSVVVGKLEPTVSGEFHRGHYQRFMNVYAKPLYHIEDYVAPSYPKSKAGTEFLKKVLSENFIFRGLNKEEIMLVIDAMHRYKFDTEEVIIQQGDTGDYFYVIKEGRVKFFVDGRQVGEASNGVSFGELALLYNSPRAATVIAATDCYTYRLDQHTFRTLLAKRQNQEEKNRVALLRHVEIFKDIEAHTISKIAEAMTQLTVHDGTQIIRKGDDGSVFYIIKEGKVLISDIGLGNVKYEDQLLKAGQFFGERALITGEKRAANATAVGKCTLLCISKETFESIVGSLKELIDLATKKCILSSVPIFAKISLKDYEVERLVKMMTRLTLRKGRTLMVEGKPVTNIRRGLYLLNDGEIKLNSTTSAAERTLRMGEFFGDDMLSDDPNFTSGVTATVTVDVTCDVLSVDAVSFALGGLHRLCSPTTQKVSLDKSITSARFDKISILGAGTFGQVWLVMDKINKTPYALKIQNKRELIDSEQMYGVIREKNLMETLDHPFVVKLINAYQDEKSLFMVMTFVQGGELFNVIHKDNSDGIPEDSARFYAANIYDGLMHLHERHILYRDLKPENVLISETDGYCILIDLGFAKEVTDKTFTFCGTPLYLAPEIILSHGYDKSVDNWSFGVLVFEMITGYSPFYEPNIDQMSVFKRILNGAYSFPSSPSFEVSVEVTDLIKKILVLNPSFRLGSLAGGNYDIREHPWLENFPTSQMITKQIKAPWKPMSKHPQDTSNFDSFRLMQDKQTIATFPLTQKEQAFFSSW